MTRRGKKEARATTKIIEVSPMPNTTITRGRMAIFGTGWRAATRGSRAPRILREQPIDRWPIAGDVCSPLSLQAVNKSDPVDRPLEMGEDVEHELALERPGVEQIEQHGGVVGPKLAKPQRVELAV